MKALKNLILTYSFILLFSCTVSEKQWHESASKLGGQSIYIPENGIVSVRINNKVSSNPNLNIFDSRSADIGYAAMNMLYKQHKAEYESNPNSSNNVYILDLRNAGGGIQEYQDIIIKNSQNPEKNKENSQY